MSYYIKDHVNPNPRNNTRPLLNETHELLENGLTASKNGQNKMFQIKVNKFILHAPARAFLKCIIGHSGYFSCERCEEEGVYLRVTPKSAKDKDDKNSNAGHVCLVATNATLRTDESFRNQENKEYHHNHSPLEELPIDMVLCIPLEFFT